MALFGRDVIPITWTYGQSPPQESWLSAEPLHTGKCQESPQDIERMRGLVNADPSLLFSLQRDEINGLNRSITAYRQFNRGRLLGAPAYADFLPDDWNRHGHFMQRPQRIEADHFVSRIPTNPIRHALKNQHVKCVEYFVEASKEHCINLFEPNIPAPAEPNRKFAVTSDNKTLEQDILQYTFKFGKLNNKREKAYHLMEILLQHGASPYREIPMETIQEQRVKDILEQYETVKVLYISDAFYEAVEECNLRILEMFFQHGAYPNHVMVTRSGSVLPLYPTLARHLNPLLKADHSLFQMAYHSNSSVPPITNAETHTDPLAQLISIASPQMLQGITLLMIHGAHIPPYEYDVVDGMKPKKNLPFDVILNYSSDPKLILTLLELYKKYGGDLWSRRSSSTESPCRGWGNVCLESMLDPALMPCDYLMDCIMATFSEPHQSRLVLEVMRLMKTPHSLQHLCRMAIRKFLGYKCIKDIEKLPLPTRVQTYLRFEDE